MSDTYASFYNIYMYMYCMYMSPYRIFLYCPEIVCVIMFVKNICIFGMSFNLAT